MSKYGKVARELLKFINNSPSVYHVVENVKNTLLEQGFVELKEKDGWQVEGGQGYFVTRNDSSVIAFRMPQEKPLGFHVIASHSDSPTFKVKEAPEMTVEEKYIKLNTEKYGGMILSTWLDRPLSVAGRIVVKEKDSQPVVKTVNVEIGRAHV